MQGRPLGHGPRRTNAPTGTLGGETGHAQDQELGMGRAWPSAGKAGEGDRERERKSGQSCHLYPGHRAMLELPFLVFLKRLVIVPKYLPESSSPSIFGGKEELGRQH